MTNSQLAWIENAALAAQSADHVWPEMAACEAALESGYGQSRLALDAKNLFGTKQHRHPIFGTLSLPTKEFLNDQWVEEKSDWVLYPTLEDCFTDRMDTLERLKSAYPHYGLALEAADPVSYVTEVSKSWSTDPLRAAKVISIYTEFVGNQKSNNAESVNDAATGEN